jgi:hypothetical protein
MTVVDLIMVGRGQRAEGIEHRVQKPVKREALGVINTF